MNIIKLCTPAYVYLVISMILLLFMGIQNVGNNTRYSSGLFSCTVSNTILIFAIKFLYIITWTIILNMICTHANPIFSWILVLFPIMLMFTLIALFLLAGERVT